MDRWGRAASAACMALALLAACSGGSSPPRVAGGDQVLTFDQSSDPSTLPPPTTAGPGAGTVAPADSSTVASGGASGVRTLDPSGPVGSFAPAYLTPAASSQIVVEVRAQNGAAPDQASIDHLRGVLGAVSHKPVSQLAGPALAGGARSWSSDDLRVAADAAGVRPQGNGTAVLRLLFVHGTLGGDNSVLGVAVRGDVAAVFEDQVAASGSPISGSAAIENAVVTHEAGHLLGLVDLYLHTGRADPQHPGHSTDPQSVMYWAVESNLVQDLLGSGPPADFDSDDLADLARIRGM